MTKDELRSSVQFIIDETKQKEIDIYALVGDTYYKLDVVNGVEQDFVSLFASGIKKSIIENDKYEVMAYSTSDERKNCYYQYDLEEEPAEIQTMASVVGAQDVEFYHIDEASTLSDIDALYIVLSYQNEVVVLYKNISQLDFVDVHQRFFLVKSDHQLTKLDKDYLRISSTFQMIRTSLGTVILDLKPLEKNEGFGQVIANEVSARINSIESLGLIEDMDSFTSYLDSISSKKALLQLKNSQVIKKQIGAAAIVAFVQSKEKLKNLFNYSEDGTKLAPSSKAETRRLLKLLNDDYVISELTQSEYETLAKDIMQ